MKYIDKYIKKGNKIIEIGAGTGAYSLELARKGYDVTALELSENNLSILKNKITPEMNIKALQGNALDLSMIEDESYDVVISGQAFEHIEYFWLTLEQVKRVLKPGGLFFLIVPSTGPVHKNPHDCYRFNENAMKAMAKYINFNVIEYGTNFDEISDPWYDSFLVARKPENISADDLKDKMDNLERKVDFLMHKLNL